VICSSELREAERERSTCMFRWYVTSREERREPPPPGGFSLLALLFSLRPHVSPS
jgi:hypothetical protein